MKKTVLLCGILGLVAGVFSSCEDEFEEDFAKKGKNISSNQTTNQKRLVSTKTIYYYNEESIVEIKYEYDAKGNLTSRYQSDSEGHNTLPFNHVDTLLIDEGNVIYKSSTKFNSEGYIASIIEVTQFPFFTNSIENVYSYDEDKHIVSIEPFNMESGEQLESSSYYWYWKDGDIVKAIKQRRSEDYVYYSFEYTNNDITTPLENKTGLIFYSGVPLYVNMFGKAGKNLPTNIKSSISNTRIDWVLDTDGYPIKSEYSWAEEDGSASYTNDGQKNLLSTTEYIWE